MKKKLIKNLIWFNLVKIERNLKLKDDFKINIQVRKLIKGLKKKVEVGSYFGLKIKNWRTKDWNE